MSLDLRPNINIPPDLFARLGTSGKAQGLQQGLQAFQEGQKQARMKSAMAQLSQNPQFAPYAGLMQMYPELAIKAIIQQQDPMRQLRMQRLQQLIGGGQGQGGGLSSVWRNAQGQISDTPPQDPTGWKEYRVKPGQALQTMTNAPLQKERAEAQKGRTEAWNRSIDTRQINELTHRIRLAPKMPAQLQQNTMRALRAYGPILSRPRITYQELALGEIDLAGIMQGGVLHADEINNAHFPGWH